MPSEVDQAAPQQSIEERLGALVQGDAPADTPEVEAANDGESTDQVEEGDGEETTPESTPKIEEIEVEVEGWKGKIPAKLKEAIDKGADYTRKTQALADERRLIETQARLQQEHQAFLQATKSEQDQLRQIEAQLEQYNAVNIAEIDAETLNRMQFAANQLASQQKKLEAKVSEKRDQFRTQMLGAWDEMTSKAHDVIVKSVPNWDSVAGDVAQFAIKEGFPFEVITGHDRQSRERVGPGVVDPVFAKTLYKAMQWDKLQATKATVPGKLANAPPVVKPGGNNTGALVERSYKDARARLGKSGSIDDAVALLAMRERRNSRNR
jgi:hypothetical protein